MRLRTILVIVLGLCVIALAGLIVLEATRAFGYFADDWIMLTIMVGLFALLALAINYPREKGRYVPLMVIGLVATALAALLVVTGFLIEEFWRVPGYRGYTRYNMTNILMCSGTTFLMVALVAAQWGLLALLPIQWTIGRRFRIAVYGAGVVCAISFAVLMWDDVIIESALGEVLRRRDYDEHIMALVSVAALAGTALVPLAAILESMYRRPGEKSIAEKQVVSLSCPRCGNDHKINTGEDHCKSCGLFFRIEIEEPRCQCGYLIYDLTSAKCPECGREISLAAVTA